MRHGITVITIGPGGPGRLPLEAADALRAAKHLTLRTGIHGVSAWLQAQGIAFDTLDDYYGRFDDFDEMHTAMAEELWRRAEKHAVSFAVMDPVSDGAVAALHRLCPPDGKLSCIAGVRLSDACTAALPVTEESGQGIRTVPAVSCAGLVPDPSTAMMVTEINDRALAGEVKLWLNDLYDDGTEIVFFPPSEKSHRKAVRMTLTELDRQKKYDHTACAWIPPVDWLHRERRSFSDLTEILACLRAPDGCPWDREQTHESLRRCLLEEAYEAAGAIDEGDTDHLADELGDVLLQIVFHADIAKSCGEFNITDVTTAICRKMICRHEHVFGRGVCRTAADVAESWEKLKKAEKGIGTQASVLADVARALPALTRADKVQKRAAEVGFDWDSAQEALPKVKEETAEVAAELDAGRDPLEELGDLLFSCVNVTRLSGCDPERALELATDKFIRRFTAMEQLALADGKSLQGLTLAEMDVYWNAVKRSQAAQTPAHGE